MFKKIWNWIKSLFSKDFSLYQSFAKIAVDLVNKIKNAVESNMAQTVVDLIPGELDNKILETLKKVLPVVLEKILIAEEIVIKGKTLDGIIKELIEFLKSKTKEARTKFWLELAGAITEALSDGKITFSEAVAISQIIYSQIKK